MTSSTTECPRGPSSAPCAAEQRHLAVLTVAFCALLFVGVVSFGIFLGYTDIDVWGGLVVPMLLLALTVPVLSRSRWIKDERLVVIASASLAVRFSACYFRYLVEFHVYPSGDSIFYHENGNRIAQDFLDGYRSFFSLVPESLGTNFIVEVNGIVSLATGRSLLASSMFFSWLAFIGLLCFIAAAREGGRTFYLRHYSIALLFLPTVLFWGSFLGKESWMVFGLGIFTLGAAKIFTGAFVGLLLTILGGFATALVRPHVAALLLLALLLAILGSWSMTQVRAPLLIFLTVAVMAGYVSSVGASLLPGFERGISETLAQTTDRTSIGGSMIEVSSPNSLLNYPEALLGVLFRPLIFEAQGLLGLLAALEGTAIGVWAFCRRKLVWDSLKRIKNLAFVRFALIFTLGFGFAWASIGNLGILVRQRTQVLPLLLVLLTLSFRDSGSESPGPHSVPTN